MAAQARAAANNLTDEERKELMAYAMRTIYGEKKALVARVEEFAAGRSQTRERTIYPTTSSLCGLTREDFDAIPKRTKAKIVRLLGQIAEKSYRRGAQQALHVGSAHRLHDDWRYGSLQISRGIDTIRCINSKRRLFEQNPELHEIGFSLE